MLPLLINIMKRSVLFCLAALCLLNFKTNAQVNRTAIIKQAIITNKNFDSVQVKAIKLLSGFSAGTSYNEIWIRDFNTFIKGSLKAHPKEEVKNMLLMFFKIQGDDGDIVDGVVESKKANVGYNYRRSPLLPGWEAHKNTVETDQESSLVQAVRKYIDVTGDTSILDEQIGGKPVIARIEDALNYIMKDRWSAKYGLVTGATTADWGDVQPETGWGVAINQKTKWAIDIYDNAMFAMALRDFLYFKPKNYKPGKNWNLVASNLKASVRKYLWLPKAQKYIPHVYLDGSPFAKEFKEDEILYVGGSICAILAGFNTKPEVIEINRQIVAAAAKEKHATIGLTLSPPYPKGTFPNMAPYTYQNGGDWTWFGGRLIEGLLKYNLVTEAYNELTPMTDRVIANKGFYEWYNVQTGAPSGSGNFRGEAGVLDDAITLFKQWAAK
jgi:glycogen debranching enzyme